ncbi:MAG: ABC transporter ATP-binding protein [bacterium]
MTALVSASGLTKRYGRFVAVDNASFEIEPGKITGLVGPNGAGKSTTLKAILGLCSYSGQLSVLGKEPKRDRASLMQDVSYISDVAALPEWIKVSQLLRLMRETHPAFDQSRSEAFLEQTDIRLSSKVNALSKGMKTQLHLALVMGIDAKLLVLDEPTLGLDILYRKKFYQQLLNEYFDEQKTILVTTHQIEEIEHILTDVLFINKARIILDMPVEEIGNHFVQVRVSPDQQQTARQLDPLHETRVLNDSVMMFRDADRSRLRELGALHTPNLADLFVACVEGDSDA